MKFESVRSPTVQEGGLKMKKSLLAVLLMAFLADRDVLIKDTIDHRRINIRSRTGEIKGWLKKDILQDRVNVYDKYGNRKGWLERDPLRPDTWRFTGN